MPFEKIEQLLQFGLNHDLMEPIDAIPVRNGLYDLFRLSPPDTPSPLSRTDGGPEAATDILNTLIDYGVEIGLIPLNTPAYCDLLDGRIMGFLTPSPSEVRRRFDDAYLKSPEQATDYFYRMSRALHYIQTDKIEKNLYWRSETEFGELEITVNLSKPEKDPKEIAAAKAMPQTHYPKCLLCVENMGFAGSLNHPARQNLRLIPIQLDGEPWYFQYSPYVYYNEHCIVLNERHVPMKISEHTFRRLFEFISVFPHYFIGSNADLPIVGGSILTHDHFQGGRHVFPMEKAESFRFYRHERYPDEMISLVKWPMSAIRIAGQDPSKLVMLAMEIFNCWKQYSDEDAGILAFTGDTPHNTVTPIARKNREGLFECDLVLRNNRTSEEHPLGIFHPHANLHHIKKENIGLIEVMGLAVLPGRLEYELKEIEKYLTGEATDIQALCENGHPLYQHADWIKTLMEAHGSDNHPDNAAQLLRESVGHIFMEVLCDAGVYKTDEKGKAQFHRLMESFGFRMYA